MIHLPVTLTIGTIIDVTGIGQKCNLKSVYSRGVYPYGFEKHIYSGGFKMPSNSCCDFTFSWRDCCRNVAITTGATAQYYYTETLYNRCLAPKNSSPAAINEFNILGVKNIMICHFHFIL